MYLAQATTQAHAEDLSRAADRRRAASRPRCSLLRRLAYGPPPFLIDRRRTRLTSEQPARA